MLGKIIKKKNAINVGKKFESILLESGEHPQKIQCDEGTEFQEIRKNISKKYGFSVFHTFNREIKAAHVERVIQTLKTMVRRVLTLTGEFNYEQFLPAILQRYNDSPHKSLFGLTPHQVYVKGIKVKKYKTLQKLINKPIPTKIILKKGNRVRIARLKTNIFEKSSLRRWTDETFIINKVYITDPVTYTLKDVNNEVIQGIFYREELQKI